VEILGTGTWQETIALAAAAGATSELMFVHVNPANEQVAPMPPDRWHAVSTLASAHAALPIPPNAGRHIRMPER
jgi:hypothetical protein